MAECKLQKIIRPSTFGIGKDLGLFGAFSFDITQANTTLADDTRHSGQSVKSVYSKSFYQTGTNIQVAGYRYSTQGFYKLIRQCIQSNEWLHRQASYRRHQ